MSRSLPAYDLAPLNSAIANYQADPENSAVEAELVNQLYRLRETIGAAVGGEVGEADDVLKIYEAILAETVVDPGRIGPAQYAPLEKLMDKDARAGADPAAILVAEGRQAVVARFYRHLKNVEAAAHPELIAEQALAAKARGRVRELEQRQGALNKAVNAFLANPKDATVQAKLAQQLAWFQECILKHEQERLSEAGIAKSMVAADDRVDPMVVALNNAAIDRSRFTREHTDILQSLTNDLLAKANGEKADPATQQASAVSMFAGYVWDGLTQAERTKSPNIEKAAVSNPSDSTKAINYLLAASFAVVTLGLIMLGLSLTLPLIAPSLAFGLVLAPPLALGLASSAAVLAPVSIYLMSSAFHAARLSTSFGEGIRDLARQIGQAFSWQSSSVATASLGSRGSLNADPSPLRSTRGSLNADDHPLTPSGHPLPPPASAAASATYSLASDPAPAVGDGPHLPRPGSETE